MNLFVPGVFNHHNDRFENLITGRLEVPSVMCSRRRTNILFLCAFGVANPLL